MCLFPYSWHVDAHLLRLFCERTKEHVQTVLSRYETPEMVDVPLLVSALRSTMQFERVSLILEYSDIHIHIHSIMMTLFSHNA